MPTLENLTVAKTIVIAIGLGAILIKQEISFSLAYYFINPILLGGVMLGGYTFGIGILPFYRIYSIYSSFKHFYMYIYDLLLVFHHFVFLTY
jgi:hypothetical protein